MKIELWVKLSVTLQIVMMFGSLSTFLMKFEIKLFMVVLMAIFDC